MKKLNFFYSALAALALTVAFTSCSKDEDSSTTPPEPSTAHYDLTVGVGLHGGMSKDDSHIVLSVNSLSDSKTIDFKGQGAEIKDYTMESIYDGEYMYQVPVSADRFSKLKFENNKMTIVKETKFGKNTYSARKYAHAWVGRTLIVMAADGDSKNVLWTKINADDMSIISEGTLKLTPTEGYDKLTTTGILTYRKSDNKLFYFYYGKGKVAGNSKDTNEPYFHIAVVNPGTMDVEKDFVNTAKMAQMQGSAFGQLLQDIVFFDADDNLYLSVFNTVSKKNIGQVVRIKKGEYDFEAGYNAFPDAMGKILTIQYLGGNKALAYSGDADAGTSIQSIAYYYSILDLSAQKATRLQYNGQDIDYSGGSFSQRSVYNAKENKAYFGVSTETEECVYVYDVASGAVTKGITIAPGYYFDQIRYFEK